MPGFLGKGQSLISLLSLEFMNPCRFTRVDWGSLPATISKSASDLGLPLVGIGLFYHEGYFTQAIDAGGWQRETYPRLEAVEVPLAPATNADGPIVVTVDTEPARFMGAYCI